MQVPEPEFEGQTKTRLGNPEVRKIVEGIVSQVLTCLGVAVAHVAVFARTWNDPCKACPQPLQDTLLGGSAWQPML